MGMDLLELAIILGFVVADDADPRRLHGARLHRRAHAAQPGARPRRAPLVPAARHEPRPRPGLEGVREGGDRLLARSRGSLLYLILRTQTLHPWNPQDFHSMPWDVTFNTVSSFVTNTNWQYYGGETTMTLLQPDGRAGGAELRLRGRRHRGRRRADPRPRQPRRRRPHRQLLGRPLPRDGFYVLLPIAFIAAIVLISQGVLQTLGGYVGVDGAGGLAQTLARGPVASQEAIKELGTNGGGFFNVNSSMPFENANGLTNALEIWLDPRDPGGADVDLRAARRQPPPGLDDLRRSWALLFLASVAIVFFAERHATPGPAVRPGSSGRTWRARSCASAPAARRCGRRSRPSPRAAR